jgi:hypothetical protein
MERSGYRDRMAGFSRGRDRIRQGPERRLVAECRDLLLTSCFAALVESVSFQKETFIFALKRPIWCRFAAGGPSQHAFFHRIFPQYYRFFFAFASEIDYAGYATRRLPSWTFRNN